MAQETTMTRDVAESPDQNGLEDEELKRLLQLQVADITRGKNDAAADSADEYLRQQTTEHGFKGFVKKIWFGNIARDYVRQRAVIHSGARIMNDQNIYTDSGGTKIDHDEAMRATIQRLTSEYDLLHEGETNVRAEDVEGGVEFQDRLKSLISAFAKGDLGYDELEAERGRLVAIFGAVQHRKDRAKGHMYADNVIEVARNAKAAVRHGIGLDAIDQALELKVADVRLGVRTKASRELTDRIVDAAYSTNIGSLVNEATIATAAAVAIAASKFSVRKVITAVTATVGLGVGAGFIAGIREAHHVKQERRLHSRQMAEGASIQTDGGRREQMEATRYRTVSAVSLIDSLSYSEDQLNEITNPAGMHRLLQAVTNAQTRIDMSDELGVDLITYDSKTAVEQQRLALDIALAKAKVMLQNHIDQVAARLQDSGQTVWSIDEVIQHSSELIRSNIQEDIQSKDQAFRRLQIKRVLGAAALGFAAGTVIGEASQEIRATLDHSLQGLFDHYRSADRVTELAGIFHNQQHPAPEVKHPSSFSHSSFREGNSAINLPPEYRITKSHDLVGPAGQIIARHVGFAKDGQLNPSTLSQLESRGFTAKAATEIYHNKTVNTSTIKVTPSDYVAAHPDQFTPIHRELWYDNNSPYPDQNELETWWGGQNYSGIDAKGNFVLNVSHMSPTGSFEGNVSANPFQLINEHKLFLAVSLDRADQNNVILVPFDSNGNAVIDHSNPLLASAFAKVNGHAVFNGGFAEVVQIDSRTPDMTNVSVLGTLVGNNTPSALSETVKNVVHTTGTHVITRITPPASLPIEVTPVIPIVSRKGMGDLSPGAAQIEGGYYAAFGSTNPYFISGQHPYIHDLYSKRASYAPNAPELEDDPDEDVDVNLVAGRYFRSLTHSYRQELASLTKDLAKQPKSNEPKIVVVIPAAAHQEGANIYRTLEQYANQQGISPQDFEVVVFANYPQGSKPDKTVKEIRRFQKSHPQMAVRLVERQLPLAEAKIGKVRKLATDAVIRDLMDRGVDLEKVMLLSNDADSQWIDQRYLKTISARSEQEPNTDAFLGFIDWDYDTYKAYPEILIGTRFMQMLEVYIRRSQNGLGSSGANFAFRPKIYLAVGGYRPDFDIVEDVYLGRMIKAVRSGSDTRKPIAYLGRSSEVNTSARRAVGKLLKDGGAPISQWDDGFGPNDLVRNANYNLNNANLYDPQVVERLGGLVERFINQTLKAYSSYLYSISYTPGGISRYDSETVRQINRMLWALGVKSKWEPDGSIKIVDSSQMINYLKRWQTSH